MREALRLVADGAVVVDDSFRIRIEPAGVEIPRATLRGLVDRGLIIDPVPLFARAAGRLTRHGEAWVRRQWGEAADV
jgi:hypothetical protein